MNVIAKLSKKNGTTTTADWSQSGLEATDWNYSSRLFTTARLPTDLWHPNLCATPKNLSAQMAGCCRWRNPAGWRRLKVSQSQSRVRVPSRQVIQPTWTLPNLPTYRTEDQSKAVTMMPTTTIPINQWVQGQSVFISPCHHHLHSTKRPQ